MSHEKTKHHYKSEYHRMFKVYNELTSYVHAATVERRRLAKTKNTRHTPFAWEDSDEEDDAPPSMPSEIDLKRYVHLNSPRPADQPEFRRKHEKYVKAYKEMKKKQPKLKINVSPKGSLSFERMHNNKSVGPCHSISNLSIHSMPASLPSRSVGSMADIGLSKKRTKQVQTPDWSDVGSEKGKVVKKSASKTSRPGTPPAKSKKYASAVDVVPAAAKVTDLTDSTANIPTKSFNSKPVASKHKHVKMHIVSKAKPENNQPFTGFGTGNNNEDTAHKMTANVKSPCDVYATSLAAAQAWRHKRDLLESRPEWQPYWGRRKGPARYFSEYSSNFIEPDPLLQVHSRLENRRIADKYKTFNGHYQPPK